MVIYIPVAIFTFGLATPCQNPSSIRHRLGTTGRLNPRLINLTDFCHRTLAMKPIEEMSGVEEVTSFATSG